MPNIILPVGKFLQLAKPVPGRSNSREAEKIWLDWNNIVSTDHQPGDNKIRVFSKLL